MQGDTLAAPTNLDEVVMLAFVRGEEMRVPREPPVEETVDRGARVLVCGEEGDAFLAPAQGMEVFVLPIVRGVEMVSAPLVVQTVHRRVRLGRRLPSDALVGPPEGGEVLDFRIIHCE